MYNLQHKLSHDQNIRLETKQNLSKKKACAVNNISKKVMISDTMKHFTIVLLLLICIKNFVEDNSPRETHT